MAVSSFQALCAGICEVLAVPAPELAPDAAGLVGFTVRVKEVDVGVLELDEPSMPAACLLVEFGPPPEDRELVVLQALMNANFLLMGPQSPVFSRNPVNGEIALQWTCSLQDATPVQLCEAIHNIVEVALRWREDFFLPQIDEAMPPPAGAEAVFA